MADNYLEKKYEQLSKGRPIIRKANPSLDSLLTSANTPAENPDPNYMVSQRQAEAAVASARRLGMDFSATYWTDDSPQIKICCHNEYELGSVVTVIRLKLAELRLHADISLEGNAAARMMIYRPKA